VVARFSLPQGENNKMVGFFSFSSESKFALELGGYPIILF
jgi:hypothetical protein